MAKRIKKIPEPFWSDCVNVYFTFCKENFNEIPSFSGSSPRDLKNIIITLRKRCEAQGSEWSYEAATGRLKHFLEHCFADNWLRDNFLLSNLDRQKDKIFFNISKSRGSH